MAKRAFALVGVVVFQLSFFLNSYASSQLNVQVLDLESLTCQEAQARLEQLGSAKLLTRNLFNQPIYLDAVSTIQCLPYSEKSRPLYLRTRDNRVCHLGYAPRCEKDSAYEGAGA